MELPILPAPFAPVADEIHTKWLSGLKTHGAIYLYGMFGSGKTAQAVHFGKFNFYETVYFSANETEFIPDVEEFFATFKKKRHKVLLILDDLQWLTQPTLQTRFFNLLLKRTQFGNGLQMMLLSRSPLPNYLTSLRLTQQLQTVDNQCLLLSEAQVLSLVASYEQLAELTVSYQKFTAQNCLDCTSGHGLWAQIYLLRMNEEPLNQATAQVRAREDMYYHMDHRIFERWSDTHRRALTALGVFHSFDTAGAKAVLGDGAEGILSDMLSMDSFLKYDGPHRYHFPEAIYSYLAHRLAQLDDVTRTQLYQTAAHYYEERRAFDEALRCYRASGRTEEVVRLVVYLLENAEGCVFAELSAEYMDLLTPERERQNPSIIGAKAMLAAYRMDPEGSRRYLAQLKQMAEDTSQGYIQSDALSVYVRTLIASPCVTVDELKENLMSCMKYVKQNGVALKHIMPTGNFPSVMNGGLDLLPWANQHQVFLPLMKPLIAVALGKDGVGAPDVSVAELYFEQGQSARAIATVTHALSDATYKGSIRVQYAAVATMVRIFQSEGQDDSAQQILQNFYEDAQQRNYLELLPNISASMIHDHLLRQNVEPCTHWLNTDAPDEHATFYTTARFTLLTKAQVYTMLGRDLEALHIIEKLQDYATMYHRIYMAIELEILTAIILYRRKENWQDTLLKAVLSAQEYTLTRVFADQGAALLPLWQKMEWKGQEAVNPEYVATIFKGLKAMTALYPKYLQVPPTYCQLSKKEMEVLRLVVQGNSNVNIGQALDFSRNTAKFHVSNIMKKLGVDTRAAIGQIAQEQGLV